MYVSLLSHAGVLTIQSLADDDDDDGDGDDEQIWQVTYCRAPAQTGWMLMM